jgi:pimeloyl-ACP methyl ester carboxylesterase
MPSHRIEVDEHGSGSPLVLVHGLGTNRGVWRAVVPLLEEGRRLIALDLPGFGDSPPLGPGFEIDEAAGAVGEAIAERLDGPYDLLGHSLGGAVTLMIARQRPDAVRSLVLCAPAGFRPRARPVADAVAAAAPVLLRARRRLGRPLASSAAGRRALLWGAVHDGGRLSEDDAVGILEASAGSQRLGDAALAAILADLADELERVSCPVGLLWGGRDPLMSPATVEAIRHRRADLPTAVVPEAGHVAQLERPEAFAAALEDLLERLGSAVTVS